MLAAAPFLLGCGSSDEIRTYPIPKESTVVAGASESQPAEGTEAKPAEATHRMMGAILPVGDQAWFFKVVGPISAMDAQADKIAEFFKTVNLKTGEQRPTWKAPEGWQEGGPSPMRAATITIPAEGDPLELTVTTFGGGLLSNVNRWRGQLGLPPVDERGLAATLKETKAGDAMMYLFDERGQFASSMTPPFAGGGPFRGGARPPMATPGPSAAEPPALPPGHPPVDGAAGPTTQPRDAPLTFQAPEGWNAKPASGFRKAAFDVVEGDKSAELTVIDLSSMAPNVADALENVNRWRGEIGLAPIKSEQLAGNTTKMEVDGSPAQYVEMIPDANVPAESAVAEATIAAIVEQGDLVWFIKLRGDRELVSNQRDNFKSFLKSVRFRPAGGAGDGN